jgi:Co/Zn/Cd efflux system component
MHRVDHSRFRKGHDFVPYFSHAERRTRIVIGITAAMMVLEIVVGLMSNSMALLADGWHMSTHVLAFLITAVAYYFARTQAGNARFSFGTGKIGVLGGFTSAVVLAIVALLMAGESCHRLFVPLEIHFNEAIGIACLGLLVNLGCALLLADRHHEHDGASAHEHDLNLRAAYTPASSNLPDEIRRAVESDGDSVVTICMCGRSASENLPRWFRSSRTSRKAVIHIERFCGDITNWST